MKLSNHIKDFWVPAFVGIVGGALLLGTAHARAGTADSPQTTLITVGQGGLNYSGPITDTRIGAGFAYFHDGIARPSDAAAQVTIGSTPARKAPAATKEPLGEVCTTQMPMKCHPHY